MTNDQLKDEEFCYINLDDERVSKNLSILQDIYDLHIRWYQNEPVFFFDEIQNVKGWGQFINRLYEKGAKIYITGSNASLLSSEISTSLTGRNKELFINDVSSKETDRKWLICFLK